MRVSRRALALFMPSAALVLVLGCDSRPAVSTSTTEAVVKGTVTIKGKPATKGEVEFDPSNYVRKDASARRALISKDGAYEIKTLVGTNTIKVISQEGAAAGATYMSYTYEVPGGESTFDIKLPKE